MTKARDLADASTALSAVSATELGYLDGVTSAVQTQLNTKQPTVTNVSDTEIGYLDGVTSAIQTQIDSKAPTSTTVTLTGAQTLTNKTLTTPVISSISNTGTVTVPTSTGTLALTSGVINNTLTSTTGDTIYASSANTPARLGIGSSGQVLTVSGGVPAWATPATPAPTTVNWTLVNAGGTALTGATTITVSGISGADKLYVVVTGASTANSGSDINLRINTDTGSNYYSYGMILNTTSTYNTSWNDKISSYNANPNTYFRLGSKPNDAAQSLDAGVVILGGNSSGIKTAQITGAAYASLGTSGNKSVAHNSYWSGSATISSISIVSSAGNFDAGTVFVYKSV